MTESNGQSGAQADPLTQAWRFATSLRVGIVLLALIAAASVVGVIMPQPESFRPNSYVSRRIDPQSPKALSAEELGALKDLAGVEDRRDRPPTRDEYLRIYYVDHYGRLGGWLLLRLSVHRLFHSWWFRGLCLLFLANLMGCSLRRLPGQWRRAFGMPAGREPRWFERRSVHASLERAAGPSEAASALEQALREHGFRVARRRGGETLTLDAARGLLGRWSGWGRMGSQVVHLGVVLIVLGGFVSGLLSRSHDQVAAPGDVIAVPPANSLLLKSRQQLAETDWRVSPGSPSLSAAFRLRLERFDVRFTVERKPEYYGAHVAVLNGRKPLRRVIEVNRPLIWRGYHVYQQSYQADYSRLTSVAFRVARVERSGEEARGFHGQVAQAREIESVEVAVAPGQAIAVPGTKLTLRVLKYFPHWVAEFEEGPDGKRKLSEPHNASNEVRNPAILVRAEAPGSEPFERWLFLMFPEGDRGRTLDYGPFRIVPTDVEPGYSTVLEFKTHPILWPVWLGCGVMTVGIALCFYCNHERIWALVTPAGGGSALWLAGDAFKWRDRFRERFDALVEALEKGESRRS